MAMGADAARQQRSLDTSGVSALRKSSEFGFVVVADLFALQTIERRGSGAFSSSDPQLRSPRKTNERVHDAHVLSKLQQQVDELSGENQRLHAQLDSFNEKLHKREQEISRLSKLTVQAGGSTADDAARKIREQDQQYADQAAQEATDLHVEQLQAQVDLLNGQVAKYEARLKEANDEIRRNNMLAEKLRYAAAPLVCLMHAVRFLTCVE